MKINRKTFDLSISSNDEMRRSSDHQGSQPPKRTISCFFKMARNEALSKENAKSVLSELTKFIDEMEFHIAELDAELQLAKGVEEIFLGRYEALSKNHNLNCVIN